MFANLLHAKERSDAYTVHSKSIRPPLNFSTFRHISGFEHKDMKLFFFVKNQQQVGHSREMEEVQ